MLLSQIRESSLTKLNQQIQGVADNINEIHIGELDGKNNDYKIEAIGVVNGIGIDLANFSFDYARLKMLEATEQSNEQGFPEVVKMRELAPKHFDLDAIVVNIFATDELTSDGDALFTGYRLQIDANGVITTSYLDANGEAIELSNHNFTGLEFMLEKTFTTAREQIESLLQAFYDAPVEEVNMNDYLGGIDLEQLKAESQPMIEEIRRLKQERGLEGEYDEE